MRKVFHVELTSEDGCTEFTLPATPYALLDAVERLWLAEGETPRWEILQSDAFPSISMYLDRRGTLPELNALAQRLAHLDERGLSIVAGLVELEHRPQDDQPVPPAPADRPGLGGQTVDGKFLFLNAGEFESCVLLKTSKFREFASPARYFYFTHPNF